MAEYPGDLPDEHRDLWDRSMAAAREALVGGITTDADMTQGALDRLIVRFGEKGISAVIGQLTMLGGLAVQMLTDGRLFDPEPTFDQVLDHLEERIRAGGHDA